MANITVRLTKRVKIIDAYSKDLLSEFSSRVSAGDFQIFLVTMTKMPWRYCPVVVDGSGRYNVFLRPTPWLTALAEGG